jgi:hypothetical protein
MLGAVTLRGRGGSASAGGREPFLPAHFSIIHDASVKPNTATPSRPRTAPKK